MELLSRFFRKLGMFVRRDRYRRELEEEMAFHRDLAENVLRGSGMKQREARHAANRQFGNSVRLKEQSVEIAGFRFERVIQDCRYALRQIAKAPGFAFTVILTMALGIGATTAIFTLVHTALLQDLPYPRADRLVHIKDERLQGQSTAGLVGVPRFFDLRARSQSFESLGFFYFDHPTLVAGSKLPVAMKAVGANGDFWKVLDVQPLLGRTFNAQDDQPNVPDAVVLSYAAWQQIFGGDADVIAKQVALDQKRATIVGVMPRNFHMPSGADLWRPAHFDPADWGKYRGDGTRFINVFGRLKPRIPLPLARKDLQRVGEQLQREHSDSDSLWQFGAESLRDDMYGELRPALLVLLSASGFLLIIACVNVANLLLSRAASREREVALRRALGASSGRITLQFLAESTVLAVLGGACGLGSAFLLVRLAASRLPGRLATPGVVAMHWPVVGFALALSVATGIAFGLAPGWLSRKVELNTSLKRGEQSVAGPAANRTRYAFISVQVGLSLILLVGAALLAESLWKLLKSPLGFEPDHLLTFSINLPWNAKEAQVSNFFRNVQQRIESLPGVAAAGQIDALPTVEWNLRSGFDADWLPRIANRPQINAEDRHIAGDYLKAAGTPLLAGRPLTEDDAGKGHMRVLVNQKLVEEYLPHENPIGRHLIVGNESFEIVGVIGNVRGTAGSIARAVGPEVYWPADGDIGVVQRYFVVRSHVPPEELIEAVREQIHQVDPQQAIGNVSTMDDLLDKAIAQPRLNMVLVAFFAGIALLLACVGIYGVVSYSVAQRTREIGVRMALGATKAQISAHFMRSAMIAAAIGLATGTCAALLFTQLLRSQLYGIRPNHPQVYVVSAALLFLPVLVATLRPALAAASINPVEALRAE